MKILDIGAGITYVDPKRPSSELPKEQGGVQEAHIRWVHRNTKKKVKHALAYKGQIFIDGVDLEAPEDFSRKKFAFRGFSINEIPNKQYDAITWLYPNPWQIFRPCNGQLQEKNNPLEIIMNVIKKNLPVGNLFLFETDMEPVYRGQYESFAHSECTTLRVLLSQVLTETQIEFHTDESSRRFGCVYKKK